ncbi:uncharacterized, partial [Tachysurus ichikawai]
KTHCTALGWQIKADSFSAAGDTRSSSAVVKGSLSWPLFRERDHFESEGSGKLPDLAGRSERVAPSDTVNSGRREEMP